MSFREVKVKPGRKKLQKSCKYWSSTIENGNAALQMNLTNNFLACSSSDGEKTGKKNDSILFVFSFYVLILLSDIV